MTTSPARRRTLATSPFRPQPEAEVPHFECGDQVNHDVYGVGRVVSTDADAVTVDFGSQKVRVMSPFRKMSAL
jgi:transcription elongation factor GreA-like protein